jgi:transposase-like protein
MELNVSNEQMAHELSINESDAYQMTTALRGGMVKKKPAVILSNEAEYDEAYVIAGHKGQPVMVKHKGRTGRRRRRKGTGGRGTMEKERPPVFGMMERGGHVVIPLLANVKQKTIEPLMKDTIASGTLVYTDEYSIYARLETWGYDHKSVHHGRGEFARDEDGDGLCEVHVRGCPGTAQPLC